MSILIAAFAALALLTSSPLQAQSANTATAAAATAAPVQQLVVDDAIPPSGL